MISVQQVQNALRKESRLTKNFLALGLVQATNFIIPLITFPYLVRVVGLEKFGVISYGLTVLTYLMTLVDYGFNLSATKQVALQREDSVALSLIFGKVMTTKLVLLTISILIMLFFCLTVDRFRHEFLAYFIGMLYVLGNALMPIWFFQGLERMKFITYANVITKVVQLLLLFLIVRSKQDYVFVLGLYGIANIVSGVYSNWQAITQCRLTLRIASWNDVLAQLRDGWYFFSSTLSITIASSATILLLGFFVSNTEIGYYSIAEKIVFVGWTMLGIFSQAIYPSVCRLTKGPYLQLRRFVWKITLPVIGLTGLGCLVIFGFADEVVHLILGHYEEKTTYILRILIVVPFIVSLNIPAYQLLLAYDYKKEYAAIFNGSAVANVLLCVLMISKWGVIGAVVCMIIIQTIITVSLHILVSVKLKKLLQIQ